MTESELMKTEQIQLDELNPIDYPNYIITCDMKSAADVLADNNERNQAHQKMLDNAASEETVAKHVANIREKLDQSKPTPKHRKTFEQIQAKSRGIQSARLSLLALQREALQSQEAADRVNQAMGWA